MLKFAAVLLVTYLALSQAKPLTELKMTNIRVDTEHVDCKSSAEILDACGLEQGFSYRHEQLGYPTNQTFLMSSCRRQSDALKCLKAYSKCLQPLSRQVLLALVGSRQRYNKKLCSDKPNETSAKFLDFNQCVRSHPSLVDRAAQAEVNSIATSEALTVHKIDNLSERLKQSCCSVARARKEFMEATNPSCKQYSQVASDHIDSYLTDSVAIICPNFEQMRHDCDKLPKIPAIKATQSRNFIRPMLNVVQTLA